MNFNSKDLILDLLSLSTLNTKTCGNSPPPTTKITAVTGAPDWGNLSPEQSLVALAVLKRQLKIQLDQTENQESVLKKVYSPQTFDAAQALSKRLDKALAELEAVLEDVAKTDLPTPDDKSAEKK